MSISSLSQRRPFLFVLGLAIGAAVVFLVVFAILRGLFPGMDPSDTDLINNAISYSLLAAVTAWLLNHLGWWQSAGFRRPYRWLYLLLFWLPAFPLISLVVALLAGIQPAAIALWRFALLFFIAVLVGFVEEGIFRGLMVRALYPKGIWTAAWVSAILFGLVHSVNFALGYNPQAVALQLVYATAIYGLASAALVIYTGSIWPILVIHALIDFSGWLFTGTTLATQGVTWPDVFSTLFWSVVAIGYGVLLLVLARRARRVQLADVQ